MTQLLLILLGLFSNPSSTNTANAGNDDTAMTASAPLPNPNPSDTGGETGQVPPRK